MKVPHTRFEGPSISVNTNQPEKADKVPIEIEGHAEKANVMREHERASRSKK